MFGNYNICSVENNLFLIFFNLMSANLAYIKKIFFQVQAVILKLKTKNRQRIFNYSGYHFPMDTYAETEIDSRKKKKNRTT